VCCNLFFNSQINFKEDVCLPSFSKISNNNDDSNKKVCYNFKNALERVTFYVLSNRITELESCFFFDDYVLLK
jgi:hypothetical protein